ncbi:MAG: hypothetical protein CMN93_03790 [Synechococcus sp. CPC35]|nr:hypothetical protein [Synechococcus sp. CPC35]
MLGTQESQKKDVPLRHRARSSRRKPEQTITIGFLKAYSRSTNNIGQTAVKSQSCSIALRTELVIEKCGKPT